MVAGSWPRAVIMAALCPTVAVAYLFSPLPGLPGDSPTSYSSEFATKSLSQPLKPLPTRGGYSTTRVRAVSSGSRRKPKFDLYTAPARARPALDLGGLWDRAMALGATTASSFSEKPKPKFDLYDAPKVGEDESSYSVQSEADTSTPAFDVTQMFDGAVGTLKGYADQASKAISNAMGPEGQTAFTEWKDAVWANTVKGADFNVPGQWLTLPPLFLFLVALVGHIPFIDMIQMIAGPGLLVAGTAFLGAGIADIGKSLSPWLQPAAGAQLKEDGAFGLVRHPMYGGALMLSAGLSLVTEDFERLMATAVMFLVMDKAVGFEEACLRETFQGYQDYTERVGKKFIPFLF